MFILLSEHYSDNMDFHSTIHPLMRLFGLVSLFLLAPLSLTAQAPNDGLQRLNLKLSFGHTGPKRTHHSVVLNTKVTGMIIQGLTGESLEPDDRVSDTVRLNYGAGDVDELVAEIAWAKPTAERLAISERDMWPYLLKNGSPGQIERLSGDPWNIPDAPLVTVRLNDAGTEGFSFSLEQLLQHGAMWLPEQDVYLTNADRPTDFAQHTASLTGTRTLERVKAEPEASLEQFKATWKDFGNPVVYDVPWQTEYLGTTGHLTVTAAAHGSIYKFAIDRWGNVRPDYASPHRLGMNLEWEGSQWNSQAIEDGLPVVVTNLEKAGQTLAMQQFAAPLGDIDAAIRGYLPSVFFSKINIAGPSGSVDFRVGLANAENGQKFKLEKTERNWIVVDSTTDDIVLMIDGREGLTVKKSTDSADENDPPTVLSITGPSEEQPSREIVLKFPSPPVARSQMASLEALNFSSSYDQVVDYWNHWIEQGAYFHVPEEEVNDLFRANLWHALILPRHTLNGKGEKHMDLPYANTAYGQENSDWPINQAVYVDYMIYGLRGYPETAWEEIASMFKTQQEPNGRMGGYANWGVYSPGHLYAIAQNYLLSQDWEEFERMLPAALKTLDWCLEQIARSAAKPSSSGLIVGPLNDLTPGEKEWAFTQAYFVAGLALFGEALRVYDHPRANEATQTSAEMKQDVVRAFAQSSVLSPVTQLADGTWINYVPTDASTPRRMLDEWYPTDVDTGPLHLSRLGVFEPYSWLTNALLNDHEDNLFLSNRGAANEPVYVQQATAYLLRDEPKAAIRSFYSLMACAFSHGQKSSLEHRWAHGQYYGPPSTDGAWFELYRKMLLNEWGRDTLMIGQAVPRPWLREGKRIEIRNAPTYFGTVSFTVDGLSSGNEIVADVELSDRNPPRALLVRFRHPQESPIRSVTVNGESWEDYDATEEYIRIPQPTDSRYVITAKY